MTGWKAFWDAVNTPSDETEGPHKWTAIACGHVLIGAALAALVGLVLVWPVWVVALFCGILYWIVKELPDLHRNGDRLDGGLDALFVALGAAYMGPAWWPFAAIVMCAAGVHFFPTIRPR